MPRRFNRRQSLENQAFLAALGRSGNVRLAARELGVQRSTFTKRRGRDAGFAAEWDAAMAVAQARLQQSLRAGGAGGGRENKGAQVTRLANGRLQVRERGAHRIGPAARQAFLAALSATANVRLSARAAGFAHSSFYRLRDHDPAFAREMRLALQLGYDRIELALLAGFDPASCRDDAWRSNDPPPIPPMSVPQALQLLYLHQKEARLWGTRADRRRRRGEPVDEWSVRAVHKWRAERAWDRDEYDVARAAREGGIAPAALEPPAPPLPGLAQLAGDGEDADGGRPALFGGWRLKDWEERER